MSIPEPLAETQVSDEIKGIYDNLKQNFGFVPNIFGMMARSPDVLKTLLPFYTAVTQSGTVEEKYKELAYLKTSYVNGCKY